MVRETEISRLEVLEHGIIQHTYKDGSTVDLTEANRVIDLVDELVGDKRLLLLNDMRAKVTFTREARTFFRENTKPDAAVAFIINSKIGEVALNFFLKFNSPNYQLKVFQERDEGHAWLVSEAKK